MKNFQRYTHVARKFPGILAAVVSMITLLVETAAAGGHLPASAQATVSVFAIGLNNPRGLKFVPDGHHYVAQGGPGRLNVTIGQCDQVPPTVGPYTGNPIGGRISKIDSNGLRTSVVDTLPSSQTSPSQGSLVSGVADVAFIGNTLYALLAGAGCSHGVPDVPNGIIRVNTDGTWSLIADLSAFRRPIPSKILTPATLNPTEPGTAWLRFAAIFTQLNPITVN